MQATITERTHKFYCLDSDICGTDECWIEHDTGTKKNTIPIKVLNCMKAQVGLMPACVFIHPTREVSIIFNPAYPFGSVEVKR